MMSSDNVMTPRHDNPNFSSQLDEEMNSLHILKISAWYLDRNENYSIFNSWGLKRPHRTSKGTFFTALVKS